MNRETHERLGRLVKLRRQELSLSVRAAANAAHIDRATWTSLESGARIVQDRSHAAIEHVLQWPPGSIATYLDRGVTPAAAITDAAPAPVGDDLRDLLPLDRVEQQIADIEGLGAARRTHILFYRASVKQQNSYGQTG